MAPRDPRDQLIVALDVETAAHAERLAAALEGQIRHFKIGSQLFTAGGPAVVLAVQKRGAEVFLDLKFHDIPNTVAAAAREAARLGVFMFNVHASGGRAMMAAAADGAKAAAQELSIRRPLALAVTVLTSLDRAALSQELGIPSPVEAYALRLAELAKDAGLDGAVASPNEIAALRRNLGAAFTIVTPGVRPAGSAADDQSRIATPRAAAAAGATYLVVGRPIIAARDPAKAAEAILAEMAS